MGKVIVGMTMSLDGFVADRHRDASRLYPDLKTLRQTEVVKEAIRKTGAVVMGRGAYDMANGDFTGYEFQVALFVVTRRPPTQVAKGTNKQLSFTFIAEGVERAVREARSAAGQRHVAIVGGAQIAQAALTADLVDEVHIDVMPVLLGGGLRLFERLGRQVSLEKIDVVDAGIRTHLRFRVVR